MIQNGCNTPLNANPGTLPSVQSAIFDFFRPMIFTKIVKTIVRANLVETPTSFNTKGMLQPLGPQKLQMKPEGQRKWKWKQLHVLPDIDLTPDDKITILGVEFRVMDKYEWAEYGYLEFHVVEGYTGET